VVTAPLIQESNYIRHNPQKLAFLIMNMVLESRVSRFNIFDQFFLHEKLKKAAKEG
jgi:hypothetical protein